MSFAAEVAGRFARQALQGAAGEVCAVFRRSFYLRLPGERYVCVGDRSLGCGPLNALVDDFRLPAAGQCVHVEMARAQEWHPDAFSYDDEIDLRNLEAASRDRVPAEGLGCTIVAAPNALAQHARPALEAIQRWLSGERLSSDAELLIGLGPGLTPSGDDYLGGVLIGLTAFGRAEDAAQLWRWLQPRLPAGTSAISAAHLEAAAAGEGHEALHACLACLNSSPADADWQSPLAALDRVGHCSGWDGLAGVAAAARRA